MSRIFTALLLVASLLALTAGHVLRSPAPTPPPTNSGPGEDEDSGHRRAEWIEHMHRHAPGVDWRAMDAASLTRLDSERTARLEAAHVGAAEPWILAHVPRGHWVERGANNQAGRASAIDYDPASNELIVGEFNYEVRRLSERKNTSAGVLNPSTLRGRWLSLSSMA